jgi:lactoylglutathione lyase
VYRSPFVGLLRRLRTRRGDPSSLRAGTNNDSHGTLRNHLTISDLDRSLAFCRDVVGLDLALEASDQGAAFLWLGEPGRSMLPLWSIGSAPLGLRLHIAFAVELDDVLGAAAGLSAARVTSLSFFGEPTDEPSVIGWMPAAAIYFCDPDGHQLEYLAMLGDAPRPQAGIPRPPGRQAPGRGAPPARPARAGRRRG